MINEEESHEEVEANVLYRDMNINLERRDIVMTDAPLPNVQANQEIKDTHVILTAPINPEGQQQSSSLSSSFVSNMLNSRPDTSIDSIFNTKATSLVDVLVTTIAEPPLVFAITLPLPPTPLIIHIGWPLVSAVLGQMAHLVARVTNIRLDSFLPSCSVVVGDYCSVVGVGGNPPIEGLPGVLGV
ncbi:hypothetical protein Tco_1106624 [Tanacetum coccineum]